MFYNWFLGLGMVAGIAGYGTVGKTLVIYLCRVMLFAGIVVYIADCLALSRPWGADNFGPLGQAGPPAGGASRRSGLSLSRLRLFDTGIGARSPTLADLMVALL